LIVVPSGTASEVSRRRHSPSRSAATSREQALTANGLDAQSGCLLRCSMRFRPFPLPCLLLAAPAIGALLLALPARAEEVLTVMQKAGLIGTWALDCTAPPTNKNPFMTYYVTADRRVRLRADRGRDGPPFDGDSVQQAEALGVTTVRLVLHSDDPKYDTSHGATATIVVEVADDKARSMSSTTNNGTQMIKGGYYAVGNLAKTPTPTMRRCPTRPVS